MPLYYKHNNYASFQRQLNIFGYHRKFAHFVVNNSGQLDTVYHKLGTPMSSDIEDLLTLRPVLERTSDKKREEEARQQVATPGQSDGGPASPRGPNLLSFSVQSFIKHCKTKDPAPKGIPKWRRFGSQIGNYTCFGPLL